jgi:hypothetical protein
VQERASEPISTPPDPSDPDDTALDDLDTGVDVPTRDRDEVSGTT